MVWVKTDAEIAAGLAHNHQVQTGVRDVAEQVEAVATGLARVRAHLTGKFGGSFRVEHVNGAHYRVVNEDRKAVWVERGTGIFGPTGRPIRSGTHPFVFDVNEGGVPRKVVTKEIRGRPARHVLRDAAQQVAEPGGRRWRSREG